MASIETMTKLTENKEKSQKNLKAVFLIFFSASVDII